MKQPKTLFFTILQKIILYVMKTLILLCCTISLGFTAGTSYSQNAKIEIVEDQTISVEEVFDLIKEQTSYNFVFRSSWLLDLPKVELKKGIIKAGDLLERSLAGKFKYEYRPQVETILIVPKNKELEDSPQAPVYGNVTDTRGNPLIGVAVYVKSSLTGVVTNENGHYQIGAQVGDVLVYRYMGFNDTEVTVETLGRIDVVMTEKTNQLGEVMVVGYGTTTRKTNTGSISSVTSEEIENQVVSNPLESMAGRMAGVSINLNNGLPGSNVDIEIRGNNTLGSLGLSGNLPLYVIDGVPFTNFNGGIPVSDDLNASGIFGANRGMSPLSVINPKDIERIDVLKDADATAIFGARGANGVIMITTKKGKRGASDFNVNFSKGWGEVANFVKLLNTEQYLALRREAFANDNVEPNQSNAPDLTLWDQNAYTDWQDVLLGGTAEITDLQLSFSGGDEFIRYFVSGNYRENGTVYPGDMGSERYSGRINLQTNSKNKRFRSTVSANYARENIDLISTDITSAVSLPPNYPLYNDDGSLYWGGGFTNPLSNLLKTYTSATENVILNSNLEFDIFNDLTARVNLGYTKTNLDQRSEDPISSQNPQSSVNNRARFADIISSNYIIEPQLEYNFKLGKADISALIGGSFQDNLSESTQLTGTNYTYEDLLNQISAAGTITASNNFSEYKYASAFGRLNLNWDTKYIANFTFRRDASSRFGDNNKFANFGAVGAAWIFTNEQGLEEIFSFLDYGKLNVSYGLTGNDQLPNYQFLTLFNNRRGGGYQGVTTLTPGGVANPDLKWETTRKFDIGLDLGLLSERVLLKTNLYWNTSTDLLTYAYLPIQSGVNSMNTNLDAEVLNSGIEFEVNTTNIITDNFEWTSSFNLSFQKNELKSFGQVEESFYADSFRIGEAVNGPIFFDFNGVNPATGEVVYRDLDGEPGLNFTNDRYFADQGTPFFGGLNNTIRYENFTFNLFIQFVSRKGEINSLNGQSLGSLNNQNISVLDRWQSSGDQGSLWPGASAVPGSPIYSSYGWTFPGSDFFYGDASFVKIRSANLDYSIPESLASRVGMKNARVFVQGQNLFTFSKNDDYQFDPETGVDFMPPLRTLVVGINCTF